MSHYFRGNLEKGIELYIECTKKYKCTPLQVEMLKQCIQNQRMDLFQIILDASSQVHGIVKTKITVIGTLAECGLKNALRKFLMVIFASTFYYCY